MQQRNEVDNDDDDDDDDTNAEDDEDDDDDNTNADEDEDDDAKDDEVEVAGVPGASSSVDCHTLLSSCGARRSTAAASGCP